MKFFKRKAPVVEIPQTEHPPEFRWTATESGHRKLKMTIEGAELRTRIEGSVSHHLVLAGYVIGGEDRFSGYEGTASGYIDLDFYGDEQLGGPTSFENARNYGFAGSDPVSFGFSLNMREKYFGKILDAISFGMTNKESDVIIELKMQSPEGSGPQFWKDEWTSHLTEWDVAMWYIDSTLVSISEQG